MKQTSLDRYIQRAQSTQVFTEGEIMRGIRHSLHYPELGYSMRYGGKSVTPEAEAKRDALLAILDSLPRRITPELTAKGLKWWASMKNKRGEWRNSALAREVPEWCRRIVDDFDHFTFEGYYNAGNSYRDFYIPQYRVHARNGDSFAYCYGAWQSNACGLEVWE